MSLEQQIQGIRIKHRDAIGKATRPSLAALSSIRALVYERIIREGKATNGSKIAEGYTDQYAKFREKKGRQTGFVDLFFEGTMMNSYALAPSVDGFVLGFTNRFQGIKMRAHEKRYKKEIIFLSDEEIQKVKEIYEFELSRQLDS